MIVKSIYVADDKSEWDTKEHAESRDEYIKLVANLRAAENAITTRRLTCLHPVVSAKYQYIERDPLCQDEEYYELKCLICEHKWSEETINRAFCEGRTVIKG